MGREEKPSRQERRDARKTDRAAEDALRKHGPGLDALAEAVRNSGEPKKKGGR